VGGDRPTGLLIGGIVAAVLVLLPALIVPTFYLFANVYGLITGGDFSSDTMNVAVFLTGLVICVALFLLLMAGAVAFVGRALSPKRPDAEQP
jgi:TRAP-type mannitol/chloroaromatic compound transport system permease small subunit